MLRAVDSYIKYVDRHPREHCGCRSAECDRNGKHDAEHEDDPKPELSLGFAHGTPGLVVVVVMAHQALLSYHQVSTEFCYRQDRGIFFIAIFSATSGSLDCRRSIGF